MPEGKLTKRTNIMKKIISILLVFAAMLSLSGCIGKIRVLENYSIGEYNGGWSVLYTDEKGVEEIAAIGEREQPLVIHKGRIYFLDGGTLVSVNMEGEERLELPGGGLTDGWIFRMDESYLYCIDDKTSMNCMRADLAQTAWEEVCLPEDLRTVDYEVLLAAIEDEVKAENNHIRVSSGRVTLDGNGRLYAMELDIIFYTGKVGSMYSWGNGVVNMQMKMDGVEVTFRDRNIPLYLNDDTVAENIKLKTFLEKLQAVEAGGAVKRLNCGSYTLGYLLDEDKKLPENVVWLSTDGAEADADKKARRFVARGEGSEEVLALLVG